MASSKIYMFTVTALICIVFLEGCITPIVVTSGHFGVGLFIVDRECYGHEVVRTMITGVGVLTGANSIAIGYSDRDFLVAPLKGRHYHVKTPFADLYVGDKAVGVASQWVAGCHGEVSGRKARENIGQEPICVEGSMQVPLVNTKTEGGSE